jgi:cardiolipin synthase
VLRYLPNTLTLLRLLLALPLGYLILRQEYGLALVVGFLAGVTDALDGFAARKLGYFSQFGAALDPIADKTLVTVAVISFASVGILPWWVAMTIIARDLVIVSGALCYRLLIGSFTFGASTLSKLNMALQIGFCVLLLAAQLDMGIPATVIDGAIYVVLVIAIVSGLDYVVTWSRKALAEKRRRPQ